MLSAKVPLPADSTAGGGSSLPWKLPLKLKDLLTEATVTLGSIQFWFQTLQLLLLVFFLFYFFFLSFSSHLFNAFTAISYLMVLCSSGRKGQHIKWIYISDKEKQRFKLLTLESPSFSCWSAHVSLQLIIFGIKSDGSLPPPGQTAHRLPWPASWSCS